MIKPVAARKFLVIPLCLGALLMSACATQSTVADSPAPAPAEVPRPAGLTTNWTALQQTLGTALGSVDGAEITAPSTQKLHLRIPVSNGFGSGSAVLRPALTRALDSIVPAFIAHPEVALDIVGHTDSVGSEMHNLQLSIKRGEAVMEYLRSRGIGLDRMSADGKGEAEPIADNGRDSGRAQNRRVEIFVRPHP